MFTYTALKTAKPLIKSRHLLLSFRCTHTIYSRYLPFFLLLPFLIATISQAQTTIWLEDFTVLVRGDTIDTGATFRSRDVSNCNFTAGDKGYFEVWSKIFGGRDTDGEAGWCSDWIDLATIGAFMGGYDSIRTNYSLDGGAETLILNGDQSGQFGTVTVQAGSWCWIIWCFTINYMLPELEIFVPRRICMTISTNRNCNKPLKFFDSGNMHRYTAYKQRNSSELSFKKKVVLFSLNIDT